LPDYDTDASRDSDTSTERDMKRRARKERDKKTKKSVPSVQVNLTTGVTPKMFERLNNGHAKASVSSLGPSGNSVGWAALIKPTIRKQLGFMFAYSSQTHLVLRHVWEGEKLWGSVFKTGVLCCRERPMACLDH
jgi:hypothetical protein